MTETEMTGEPEIKEAELTGIPENKSPEQLKVILEDYIKKLGEEPVIELLKSFAKDSEHSHSHGDDMEMEDVVTRRRVGTVAAAWEHSREHGNLRAYELPKARIGWDQIAHNHDVDWADLFFDLTYVAAAFMMGNLLKYNLTFIGTCNFIVIYLSFHGAWRSKTIHDSMIEATDVSHKIIDILYMTTIATAAMHCESDMDDTENHKAFGFCISMAINSLILLVEKAELYFSPRCKEIKLQAFSDILHIVPKFGCFLAAAIAANYEAPFSTVMWIVFGQEVFGELLPAAMTFMFCCGCGEMFIAWHAEHIAHRYGEWIMLMLGESILSVILLGAPHAESYYYVCFTSSILIAQMLQLVHFSSEEFDACDHALSRKLRAGKFWMYCMSVYSAALITLGVSLKLMLSNVVCEPGDDDHRRILGASYDDHGDDHNDADDHQDDDDGSHFCKGIEMNILYLLSFSLAIQYTSLWISITLHEGLQNYFTHFFQHSTVTILYIMGSKVVILSLTLCLPWYASEWYAHDILILMAVLTIIQGFIQSHENMIVHLRQKSMSESGGSRNLGGIRKNSFYKKHKLNNWLASFSKSMTQDDPIPTQKKTDKGNVSTTNVVVQNSIAGAEL